MTELIVAARFDMYGVGFSQPDILDWQMEYGRDNENYAVELWMQQSNGNSIYWGAGDEENSLQVELDGHFGSHSLGYCYASDPDGMWTEDLCYDMDIRAVASTAPEPGTLALLSTAGRYQRRSCLLWVEAVCKHPLSTQNMAFQFLSPGHASGCLFPTAAC
jgi:hypothetical protein